MAAKFREKATSSKIVFAGGGTGGHVFPGLAIVEPLRALSASNNAADNATNVIAWIGSRNGPEKQIVAQEDILFYSIRTGKLRRYFSIKNFTDPINIIRGFFQSSKILKKHSPNIVVSIGGFVSVPVVLAARSLNIPVVSICCDISLGLATKINLLCSSILFCAYEETLVQLRTSRSYCKLQKIRSRLCKTFSKYKGLQNIAAEFSDILDTASNFALGSSLNAMGTQQKQSVDNGCTWNICLGMPIRKAVYSGNAAQINSTLQIANDAVLLLFLGGSKGAKQINDMAKRILPHLPKHYVVVHQTGLQMHDTPDEVHSLPTIEAYKHSEDKVAHNTIAKQSTQPLTELAANHSHIACTYFAYNFITKDYANFLARADIAIARAGSSTVWELIANAVPTILVPLSKERSRGDQIENARYFAKRAMVKDLGSKPSDDALIASIEQLASNAELRQVYKDACKQFNANQSAVDIARYIYIFTQT